MTTTTTTTPTTAVEALPPWRSVLVVVAHPDDESFALGAVVDAFTRNGSAVSVLCLTHGESSTLDGVDLQEGSLSAIRSRELTAASRVLGISQVTLLHHGDGALSKLSPNDLASEVIDAIAQVGAKGLLVFDPAGVTGHPDHAAATDSALLAADLLGLPVLGWTIPTSVANQLNAELGTGFVGHDRDDLDLVLAVDRTRQILASREHASQALPASVLWRRLELLGGSEHLRWLREPRVAAPSAKTVTRLGEGSGPTRPPGVRVLHRGDDRFLISVRGHLLTVDQPLAAGGDDTAPTPTELFVASLASCVAFYARRYLRRHKLPTEGLVVESDYTMGKKPDRVATVEIRIQVPEGVPADRRDAMLAVASHCTVHNTLVTPPEVAITLEG